LKISKVVIDNTIFEFDPRQTYTIFQFCSEKKIYLPCFCYHERLTIAGNCRICLVQVNNALVASCAVY
jgi:NADH dehydrogenase/NADH:ubiquinone oxidoreductase subunit G